MYIDIECSKSGKSVCFWKIIASRGSPMEDLQTRRSASGVTAVGRGCNTPHGKSSRRRWETRQGEARVEGKKEEGGDGERRGSQEEAFPGDKEGVKLGRYEGLLWRRVSLYTFVFNPSRSSIIRNSFLRFIPRFILAQFYLHSHFLLNSSPNSPQTPSTLNPQLEENRVQPLIYTI